MPATSQNQQMATAIAKNAPGKLYKRNRGLLGMTDQQLREFAATPRKGLPKRSKKVSMGSLMQGEDA